MTLVLPREILNRVEQRWSARTTQSEGFHAATDHLKRNVQAAADGAPALADQSAPPKRETPAKRN